MTVAIPVNMRNGLFKAVPFVIIVCADRTALIHIGKKRYESIVAPYRQATYLDRLAGTMHAFAEHADKLAREPLDSVIAEHPGSVAIENGDVKSFKLYFDYDVKNKRYNDHYTFEIVAARGKYKGIVDRGTDVAGKIPAIIEVFGARFHQER